MFAFLGIFGLTALPLLLGSHHWLLITENLDLLLFGLDIHPKIPSYRLAVASAVTAYNAIARVNESMMVNTIVLPYLSGGNESRKSMRPRATTVKRRAVMGTFKVVTTWTSANKCSHCFEYVGLEYTRSLQLLYRWFYTNMTSVRVIHLADLLVLFM